MQAIRIYADRTPIKFILTINKDSQYVAINQGPVVEIDGHTTGGNIIQGRTPNFYHTTQAAAWSGSATTHQPPSQ